MRESERLEIVIAALERECAERPGGDIEDGLRLELPLLRHRRLRALDFEKGGAHGEEGYPMCKEERNPIIKDKAWKIAYASGMEHVDDFGLQASAMERGMDLTAEGRGINITAIPNGDGSFRFALFATRGAMPDGGIDRNMTEAQARAWASRRWGCSAKTKKAPHPEVAGDEIAQIEVVDRSGQAFRGLGYSGLAPLGLSVWAKAAHDLARWEGSAR